MITTVSNKFVVIESREGIVIASYFEHAIIHSEQIVRLYDSWDQVPGNEKQYFKPV